jgi:uncharacterized protein YndB with AHSA1/START domain
MDNSPVAVEATYYAPLQKVWKALTDNVEMKKWYFGLDEFKLQKGFQFQFQGGTETKTYTHLCEITEVIPGKKLSHTWKYDGYPGNSTVTFELFPEGEKTRLKVTHEGLETFPLSPDFAKENFRNGWTAIIGTNLKAFLEKGS